MQTMAPSVRRCGVLMPTFSLPDEYGVGGFGKGAYNFVNLLQELGVTEWQILPDGHTDGNNCPYQCYSSIAGNPLFISLQNLVELGLIDQEYLNQFKIRSRRIDYKKVKPNHYEVLRKAFSSLHKNYAVKNGVERFVLENEKEWLFDYALFMALTDYYKDKPVWEWNAWIRDREPEAITYYSKLLQQEIQFYEFVQYLYFRQWSSLKEYANNRGLKIVGDLPIYPSKNSCDVWMYPELFELKSDLSVSIQAAVPPDYFSPTGQLWGNPVYRWDVMKERGYQYWINRFKMPKLFWAPEMTLRFDMFRIDHARGLQDYYVVPSGAKDAIDGEWKEGPRMDFFNAIKEEFGEIPVIAEDLGIVTDEVRELIRKAGLPGMRVLSFGLEDMSQNNSNFPGNWIEYCVGYTGTHDNDPIVSVIKNLKEDKKRAVWDYLGLGSESNEDIATAAIRKVLKTKAFLVFVPLWDILALGEEGKVNTPGVASDENWSLQFLLEDLDMEKIAYFRNLLLESNRLVK